MSLKEKLLNDLKEAMRDKDTVRKNAIQMARSAVLQIEKDRRVTLDDDGIIEVIAKQIKQRKEVLPEYEKSGRQDLIDNLRREIEILSQYMPQQLTEDELESVIKDTIQEIGANSVKDLGKLMQAVMPKVRGRADGKLVNQIARKLLS
ncbi:MAG TPA: GatB/YqeY domain-containing protein [Clostridiaceae bacterium]|nr:GatB/YqeY domain-containing protein [Clostridiaceae bacterium]